MANIRCCLLRCRNVLPRFLRADANSLRNDCNDSARGSVRERGKFAISSTFVG